MESGVAAIPNVVFRWFNERSGKRQVASLVRLTEAERFRTPALHDELFAAIRFDVGWRGSADEGLPPGALAIEPPLRPAFSSLRHKAVMRALTAIGAHHALGLRAGYAPCLSAPNIAVLAYTSANAQAGCWVIGRALEQLWLRATVLGFAVQPFIAPGLYSLDCYPDVPQRLRRHLAEQWATLVPEGQPLVVLRLGRAAPPAVRTGRKSARCYIRAPHAAPPESAPG
jgi:hypothetical protein